jgi:hypothetical protein
MQKLISAQCAVMVFLCLGRLPGVAHHRWHMVREDSRSAVSVTPPFRPLLPAKAGAFYRSLQHHLVEVLLLRMVFMSEGKQSRLSPAQKADVWSRWKAGESLHEMGRAYGKPHNCIRCVLLPRGGIAPAARRRSRIALTLAEREDISRGIGRAASTASREVTRHGGVRPIAPTMRITRPGGRGYDPGGVFLPATASCGRWLRVSWCWTGRRSRFPDG